MVTLVAAEPLGVGFGSELRPRFGLDGLSACFLLLIAAIGSASALAGLPEAGTRAGRACGWLGLGFVAAMALLVLARDMLGLLVAWETMSLFPAATILITSHSPAARRDLLVYLGTAHLAGVGVWIGLLYLSSNSLGAEVGAGVPLGIGVLMLVGCAAKAGLVPLQFWLPRAHPLAPPPISALMSGVMIALPFYLLIRFAFEWADPLTSSLGYGLVVAGAASAVLGAYSAVMAPEIKRLLAFSSVENMGFAAIALGLAIIFQAAGRNEAAALAIAVCVFGLVAHGLAKSTLFIATGPLSRIAGSLELDRLGGLVRQLPATVTVFTLAALSLAALPPLAGFAAEWALLQAVIEAVSLGEVAGLVLAALAVVIGLAAGLAALAFCKLVGLGLLGRPRRPVLENVAPVAPAALTAMGAMASLLLLLGLATGWAMPWLIGNLAAPTVSGDGQSAVESGVSFGLFGSGALPILGLVVALALTGGAIWWLRGGGRADPAATWVCGQPQSPRLAWSGAGFVKTLRLATTLRQGLERDVSGSGPGLEISHSGEAPHPFEWRLHRPAYAVIIAVSARLRALQTGRLRTYLVYLVVTLVVALAAVRIGLL